MNCNSFFDSRINIIVYGSLFKNFLDWESSSWDLKNGSITKETRKLLGIHSCRGNNQLDISPFLSNLFQYTKKHISI